MVRVVRDLHTAQARTMTHVHTLVSDYELKYTRDGVAQDIRADARTRTQYRPFALTTNTITNTNGSARLRLWGTDVLATVKADVAELQPGQPDAGRIEVLSIFFMSLIRSC